MLDVQNTITSESAKCNDIFDGTYFKLVPDKCTRHATVATCVKCEPRIVQIKGYGASSSNFLSHLRRKHGSIMCNKCRNYINEKRNAEKEPTFTINEVRNPTSNSSNRRVRYPQSLTQDDFEKKIAKFIIHAMIPLKIVDDPYCMDIFKNLNIEDYGLRLISRRTLGRRIDSLYVDTKTN